MSRLISTCVLGFMLLAVPANAQPELGYPRPAPQAARSASDKPAQIDPQLEARARAIGKKLRCVVCQNQSIDESDATLAADMRQLVLERLQAGDTDEQVIEYIRARYGDFVLMKPPVKNSTWLLWFGPVGFLLLGGLVFWGVSKRRTRNDDPDEDNDEAIDEILKKYGD